MGEESLRTFESVRHRSPQGKGYGEGIR
jgi:hypothetical protein